jgi:prepilin-type N-terminal cleavage/methylation domain-containing protein
MRARTRGRCRLLPPGPHEEGLTLVEMLVALAVLAILVLPLAGTFYASQSSNGQDRSYGDAVALADSALAKDAAIGWQHLGFYGDQFPGSGTCNQSSIPNYGTQQGVFLRCHPLSPDTEAVLPVDNSLKVGHVQYTLTTYVVWATASGSCSGSPCTNAEKQIYAVVTWTINGNAMSVTQNVLVYPGGLGSYSGGSQEGQPGSNPPPSVSVPASQPAPGSDTAQLNWNDPGNPEPGWYEIVMQSSSSLPAPGTASSGPYDQSWDPAGAIVEGGVAAPATNFTVSGLSSGTTYNFVIVAFSPDGTLWAVSQQAITVTTNSSPVPCQLTSLIVDQTGQLQIDTVTVKKGGGGSGGHLMQPVSITISFQGTCTAANNVVVSATGPTALGPYSMTFSSSPAQFTYNPPTGLCPATSFATGTYVFKSTLDSNPQTPTANVPFTTVNGTPAC